MMNEAEGVQSPEAAVGSVFSPKLRSAVFTAAGIPRRRHASPRVPRRWL